jgi:hypothetical protein
MCPEMIARRVKDNAESSERLVLWSAPDEEINNLDSEQLELLEEIILEGDKRKEDEAFHDALEYVWEHKNTENAKSWPPKLGTKTLTVDVKDTDGIAIARWSGITHPYAEKLYYLLTELGYRVELESDAFYHRCKWKDIPFLPPDSNASVPYSNLQPLVK